VAGPAVGWDQTVLGIAIYGADGALTYSRYAGIEKAIARGDWGAAWMKPAFNPPENWDEMVKTFERMGNAMAHLRWEGGNPTTLWTKESGDTLYLTIVGSDASSEALTDRTGVKASEGCRHLDDAGNPFAGHSHAHPTCPVCKQPLS
jgi:hypothetical protein